MEAIAGALATVTVALIGAYVALKKPADAPAPAIAQGRTIDIGTATRSLLELLAEEQQEHGLCHAVIREHGLTVPHD